MKFKVGDRVKVLDAIVDIHMIGKVAKVTKATENEVWLEAAEVVCSLFGSGCEWWCGFGGWEGGVFGWGLC